MQTRKKSISLHALGVISSTRGSGAHRSTSSSSNTTPASDSHPAKRLKRSHTLSGSETAGSSQSALTAQRNGTPHSSKDRRRSQPLVQATPPPSPDDFPMTKIDKSGIKDDIVIAVLEQLEATGNRPHLIRELAAILANSLHSVQSSSNPVAIISSRLTNYLRRAWTALAPCPLAKEQVNIQPRRVYYYLTTCPRQPIPELPTGAPINGSRIISPSISSGPDDEEHGDLMLDVKTREREALSPSPELDLSAPEYDQHNSQQMSGISFGNHSGYPETTTYEEAYQQAASPPLESDEKEFMATLRAVEQSATPEKELKPPSVDSHVHHPNDRFIIDNVGTGEDMMVHHQDDESEEMIHLRNQEAASALFGGQYAHLGVASTTGMALYSSPMIRPSLNTRELPTTMPKLSFRSADEDAVWHELKSPDCVELSELDELLSGN